MKRQPLLQVNNVSFGYDNHPILENVTLDIFPGEFVGVFGPNGGGKTTFLKLLAGLLAPTKGKISRKKCKQVGYVPQFSKFDRQFPVTVLDIVLMGCLSDVSFFGTLGQEVKTRAEAALEKVGLLSKKNDPFGTLSGGQAQRALIARAIVSEPELLLLDEPTASVDTKAEKEIYHLLETLSKQEMTIIMVSHDLEAILEKVEKVFCVQRTITELKPSEVCKHFTAGLYHIPLVR